MAEKLKCEEERMLSVMAFNLQNTNKQKEPNLEPVISLQSDGIMRNAATREINRIAESWSFKMLVNGDALVG